jgi:nucleoside-diphosphate-sugar epimerase
VTAGRILVTGGTGFIGSALVRALAERGHPVRVLDNDFRGSADRLSDLRDRIEFVSGDVREPGIVQRAVEGTETVFHLAAINGTRHFYEIPDQVLEVGILGTLNVLQAARELGVKTFISASSSEAYQTPPVVPTPETVPLCIPDPRNPRYSYGGSKLIGEILAFNFGRDRFRTVVFRPHNIYGADMGYDHVIPAFAVRLRRLIERHGTAGPIEFPIQGTGVETRAFCYISDFVEGLLILAERGEDQSVYHIGTQEEVTVRDLAERIGRLSGVDLVLKETPAPAGATPRRCPDIGKLRALGYEPQVPLDQGLSRVLSEIRIPSEAEVP